MNKLERRSLTSQIFMDLNNEECPTKINSLLWQIVAVNRPIVIALARKKFPFDWFDDSCSIGIIALHEAALRYNPTRGCSFATFAYMIVSQRIWDAVKKPGGANDPRFEAARDAFSFENCPALINESELLGNYLMLPALSKAIENLNPMSREIIEQRFGFHTYDDATLHTVAKKLNISLETVRRKQVAALRELRSKLAQENVLDDAGTIAS